MKAIMSNNKIKSFIRFIRLKKGDHPIFYKLEWEEKQMVVVISRLKNDEEKDHNMTTILDAYQSTNQILQLYIESMIHNRY